MKLSKLNWIIGLITMASGMSMLFAGSVFFYWGTWNYLMGYGVRGPPNWFFMFWGGFIIFIGILISSYLGKMLRSKYLAAISLLHLVIAPSLIYLVFSIVEPHLVYVFLYPTILSNILLDTAFIVGYIMWPRISEMGSVTPLLDRAIELQEERDRRIITQEEYEQKKKKLLEKSKA